MSEETESNDKAVLEAPTFIQIISNASSGNLTVHSPETV